MRISELGSAAVALFRVTGEGTFSLATEPLWTLVWGVALLMVSAGVKSAFRHGRLLPKR